MSAPVITVYKNGDHHFSGKKLVVNRKHYRSFENFLDKVTEDTRAGVAIRKIHTPQHGTKVASLENLRNGAIYVAAGPERFKHLAYEKIGDHLTGKQTSAAIKPVLHSKINASSRYKKEAMAEPLRNRIIYVYRNGEEKSPPVKLLLDKRTLQNMNAVLQYISNKINLTAGAVKSLYCLETGVKITDVSNINSNTLYVAVGCGKHFVKAKYHASHSDKLISPKKNVTYKLKNKKVNNDIGSGKSSSLVNELVDNLNSTIAVATHISINNGSKDIEDIGGGDKHFIENELVLTDSHDTIGNNGGKVNEDVPLSSMENQTASFLTDVSDFKHTEIVQFEVTDGSLPNITTLEKTIIKEDCLGNDDSLLTVSSESESESLSPFTEREDCKTKEIIDQVIIEDSQIDIFSSEKLLTNNSDKGAFVNNQNDSSSSTNYVGTDVSDCLAVQNLVNVIGDRINENIENKSPELGTLIEREISNNESEKSVYKASGKQEESGDIVIDDKNTVVEDLIDTVPAAEVEEELEDK